MRYCYTLIILMLLLLFLPEQGLTDPQITEVDYRESHSIIIEVEGNPQEYRQWIEKNFPFIEVITVYEKLFTGLALQGSIRHLEKLSEHDFVKMTYPVKEYQMDTELISNRKLNNTTLPSSLNNTSYTGKNVKVAVVDTGVDYHHPDLQKNYIGGYDVVDFDEDPMETIATEGTPTLHGTHVAGIIAADGELKGVAPDAEIYAYRALGPGGFGTSIQVIAAIEQAVKDGVDIINLSLGNAVNGPDFPTSLAVNKAAELGVILVIANGNSGPENWTVGSPATAINAISVGALARPEQITYLHVSPEDKDISLNEVQQTGPWKLNRTTEMITDLKQQNPYGKILMTSMTEINIEELLKEAEDKGIQGILLYEDEKEQTALNTFQTKTPIPIALISPQDAEWLQKNLQSKRLYVQPRTQEVKEMVAPFSSRGPVTIDWRIKPDILAPGKNIISTVPEGYEVLNGTSMAAPHVAGALAVLKEAHPNWTNDQLINALKTTAVPLEASEPIAQGNGVIDIKKAIETTTIINDTLITFGKYTALEEKQTATLTIENTGKKAKEYYFKIPKKQKGLFWELPTSFTVEPKSKKSVSIDLKVSTKYVEQGIHQGWLELMSEDEVFPIGYLFINETADYPIAMGYEFSLEAFSREKYQYQFYLTEEVAEVEIHLFHPEILTYEQPLLHLKNPQLGLNMGEIDRKQIKRHGIYKALLSLRLKDGEYVYLETDIFVPE